ncbi:MAG: twin-arginine translocation signal domain-containing protein [Faecalibacterium sp.]
MISRRSFLKAAMAASAVSALALDRLRRLRFQHRGCIFHCFFRCRFRSSRGRPDLQGGHRQLCGSCFPEPDRGICGEPSG